MSVRPCSASAPNPGQSGVSHNHPEPTVFDFAFLCPAPSQRFASLPLLASPSPGLRHSPSPTFFCAISASGQPLSIACCHLRWLLCCVRCFVVRHCLYEGGFAVGARDAPGQCVPACGGRGWGCVVIEVVFSCVDHTSSVCGSGSGAGHFSSRPRRRILGDGGQGDGQVVPLPLLGSRQEAERPRQCLRAHPHPRPRGCG